MRVHRPQIHGEMPPVLSTQKQSFDVEQVKNFAKFSFRTAVPQFPFPAQTVL